MGPQKIPYNLTYISFDVPLKSSFIFFPQNMGQRISFGLLSWSIDTFRFGAVSVNCRLSAGVLIKVIIVKDAAYLTATLISETSKDTVHFSAMFEAFTINRRYAHMFEFNSQLSNKKDNYHSFSEPNICLVQLKMELFRAANIFAAR